MHNIFYTRNFLKQFKKLEVSIQEKARQRITLFEKDPKDASLKAHKLSGLLAGFYSFSVASNYRIVFSLDKKKRAICFLKIGTHDVYR